MSHITKKNGKIILYCFYDPEIDDYNEALDIATKKHNLENTRFNAICKPFKKERSAKEKIKAIYGQVKIMQELCESEGREPTHAECVLANAKLAKVEELEAHIE